MPGEEKVSGVRLEVNKLDEVIILYLCFYSQ